MRTIRDCHTFVIWQYDLRGQPLQRELLQRQVDEILECGADAVLRGWFKWGTDLDYDAMRWVVDRLHERSVFFIGGLTCSAIARGENGLSEPAFLDLTTCDAQQNRHELFTGSPTSHVSIHNPRTAAYLVECALKQIRAGADGLHLDEIWGIGTAVSPHPNEGYDDYGIAAFRHYLRRKYAHFNAREWKARFDIDSIETFDYRRYLAAHATGGEPWATNPDRHAAENPLAADWKPAQMTASDICETWFVPDGARSFYDEGILMYGKRIIEGIRAGARALGREVALAQNGPWPGVDFQNWNVPLRPPDSAIAELRCHLPRWQRYRALTDQWSSRGAPAAAFIDWPGDLPAYTIWPHQQMETYLRTAPAECYAMGCSYAFHLHNWVPGSDAKENGTYPLMAQLCRWFTDHRDLFHPRGEPVPVSVDQPNVCAIAYRQPQRFIIHLINHSVGQDHQVVPCQKLTLRLATELAMQSAEILAPEVDSAGLCPPEVGNAGIRVPVLNGYAVVSCRCD